MRKKEHGLWSNCAFLLKFAYKTNKTVFFIKIPQIILNVANPFIPILFVRMILNEMTIGGDIKRLILFIVLFASATFITEVLGSVLDCFMQNQMELTVRKIKNRMGGIVMDMPYSDAEQPKIRDCILLAQDGVNFSQIIDQLSSIITSILTIAGLARSSLRYSRLYLFLSLQSYCVGFIPIGKTGRHGINGVPNTRQSCENLTIFFVSWRRWNLEKR